MGIQITETVNGSVAHIRVYDSSGRETESKEELVTSAPDFAALLDTVEDELLENLHSGGNVNTKDLANSLVNKAKKQIMGELLVKLLCILSESDNVRLDCEILISASGLPLRDIPDSAIAAKFGLMRQTFSARKKALMKKLDIAPPPHSKTLKACETYKQSNRRNGTIELN